MNRGWDPCRVVNFEDSVQTVVQTVGAIMMGHRGMPWVSYLIIVILSYLILSYLALPYLKVDPSKYPFDVNTCQIQMAMWMDDTSQVLVLLL